MMEPVTLILTALVTGAAKAAGDAAPDAYKGLKILIQKKFAGQSDLEMTLAKHEEKPKVWEEPLKEALTEAGVEKDKEILEAAQKVMESQDPEGAATGKYDLRGAQGVQLGDHNTQTNTFS